MNIRYTDGKDIDFIHLCQLLDESLDELVGGKEQRKNYHQYNTLEHIHDVFVAYDNSTPIGCASFKMHKDKVAEVKRVFVRKDSG